MLVIAHRGNNREAPENSREAFQKAVDIGAHRIEMDLRWTKDQRAVVFHDDRLDRCTGVKKRISDLDLESLTKDVRLSNGETIPCLEEVLTKFLPKIEVNLEIKGSPSLNCLRALVILLKSCSKREKIIISSFYPRPLETLYNLDPLLQRAVLWGKQTLQIDTRYYFAPGKFLNRCQSKIFHPEASLVNSRLMKLAKDESCLVFPWVPMKGESEIKKEILWKRLKNLGVHGVCTNDPSSLVKWLEANP